MPYGIVVGAGLDGWRELRAEFEDDLERRYQQAEHDTNGVLLNARGRRQGVDARTLFYGQAARVTAFASEELRDWFIENGRVTFAQFERERTNPRGCTCGRGL